MQRLIKPPLPATTTAVAIAALVLLIPLCIPLADAATDATSVPTDWGLIPSGLGEGDQFRLLIATSTKHNAVPTDITVYDTYIQGLVAAGHTDIQEHSSSFKVVGSTGAVSARDHTGTTYNSTDKGPPIYWLGGAKVADNYQDFYDGSWNEERSARDENGNVFLFGSDATSAVFTGSNADGTKHGTAPLGADMVRAGLPNNADNGPLTSPIQDLKSDTHPFYGISPVFQVENITITDVKPLQYLDVAPITSITDGETVPVGGTNKTFDELDGARGITTVEIDSSTYALVAANADDGVQIIDITNPATPFPTASITDGETVPVGGTNKTFDELDGARGITTVEIDSSTYALVSSFRDDGVQIIDITNPTTPFPTASITDGETVPVGGTNKTFDVLDGAWDITTVEIDSSTYALVAANADDGVQIIDITNPATPFPTASITDGKTVPVGGTNKTFDVLDGALGITTVKIGNSTYALVAANADDGVQIINITNPATPFPTASITDGETVPVGGTNKTFDELDGAWDITTVEIDSSTYALVAAKDDNGVQIIDITNPATPFPTASITDGETERFDELNGARGITTVKIGNSTYALVTANADDGVQIIDITNPTTPFPTASITDGETVTVDGKTERFDVLDGALGITTVKMGSSTYALVAANVDDGVQIVSILATENRPPTITLIGTNPATAERYFEYEDAGAVCTDPHGDDTTLTSTSTVDTDTIPGTPYSYTYSCTDQHGLAAQDVVRSVSVVDTIKPVITLHGSASVSVAVGDTYPEGARCVDSGRPVLDGLGEPSTFFTRLQYTIVHTVSGDTVNTAVAAKYNVVYTCSDGYNSADPVTQTVTVTDSMRPRLVSAGLDKDTGQLTLTFNESIDSSSLNKFKLYIREPGSTTGVVALSGDSVVGVTASSITLRLAEADKQAVIAMNSPHLEIAATAISDRSGNFITEPFDLTNGTSFLRSFIASQDNKPIGIAFSPDGTKMFMMGTQHGAVRQYALSTPFDVSTASYSSKFLVVEGQDNAQIGIAFSPDGTKMFMMGTQHDAVRQYALSTPFDVSTGSYSSKFLVVKDQDNDPIGIAFSPDGTKMFMLGTEHDAVRQYALSTAFDISTASYSSKFLVVRDQDNLPANIAFSPDGTKMFMLGDEFGAVRQYALSTAFDITTASYSDKSTRVRNQDNVPEDIAFSPDGTKMFMMDSLRDRVSEYNIGPSYSINATSDSAALLFSSATYNKDSGVITMTFSEELVATETNYTKIHIRATGSDTAGITFSDITTRSTVGKTVTATLDSAQKTAYSELSPAPPQLDIGHGAVADASGNKIAEAVDLQITEINQPSTVTPTLPDVNVPPTARISAPVRAAEGATVSLNGTGSTDNDGTISLYAWTANNTSITITDADKAEASFTAPPVTEDTTLAIKLVVTDDDGATGSANHTMTINDVNRPPTITLNGEDPATAERYVTYTDAGAACADPDGDDVTLTNSSNVDTDTIPLAPYLYTYSCTDQHGLAAQNVTRAVHVEDTVTPVLSLNGLSSVSLTVGDTYTDDGATCTDSGRPITVTVSGLDAVNTDAAGQYDVVYACSDGYNSPDPVTRTVTVTEPTPPPPPPDGNVPPTARISAPVRAAEGATVSLNGTGSTDNDGTISLYAWTANNTSITITDADKAEASFTAPPVTEDTTLAIKLVVTDDDGATGSANHTMTINDVNRPPTITLNGEDPATAERYVTYTDAGAACADPDGDDVTLTNSSNVDTDTIPLAPYLYTYSCTDQHGLAAQNVTRAVHVEDTVTPVLSLNGLSSVSLTVGDTYTDDGATCTDSGRPITVTVSGLDAVNTDAAGQYDVVYACSDGYNSPDPVTRTVTVTEPAIMPPPPPPDGNVPPTASISAPSRAAEGTQVTLDGTGSADTDGTIQSYNWTAGNPAVTITGGNQETASFTAPQVAEDTSLLITLKVTDDYGATGSAQHNMTITDTNQPPDGTTPPPPNEPPVISYTVNPDSSGPDSITLDRDTGFDLADLGVTCSDPEDGDITPVSENENLYDPTTEDSQSILYSCTDSDNNTVYLRVVLNLSAPDTTSDDDNEHKTRPTFGNSWSTNQKLVSCGYSMDGSCHDVLAYHVDYQRAEIRTGSTHDFALKAYAEKGLDRVAVGFGVPSVGSPFSDAEASITVHLGRNYTTDSTYEVAGISHDVRRGSTSSVIDASGITASVDSAACMSDVKPGAAATTATKGEENNNNSNNDYDCISVLISGVLFLEQTYDEPFMIQAVDSKRRVTNHYMNDGLAISGESLNPPMVILLQTKYSSQSDIITHELVRTDKINDVWTDQLGYTWTKNSYGTWHYLEGPAHSTGTACTDVNNRLCDAFAAKMAGHTALMEQLRDAEYGDIYQTQ